MRQFHILAGAALLGGLTIGGAGIAAAAPKADSDRCKVTVDRSQPADTFRVDRQTMENGDCLCYVYTGPTNQSARVETSVADILERRECGKAAAPIVLNDGSAGLIAIPAGAALTAGVAAALSGNGREGGNDSPGG